MRHQTRKLRGSLSSVLCVYLRLMTHLIYKYNLPSLSQNHKSTRSTKQQDILAAYFLTVFTQINLKLNCIPLSTYNSVILQLNISQFWTVIVKFNASFPALILLDLFVEFYVYFCIITAINFVHILYDSKSDMLQDNLILQTVQSIN